MDIYMFIKYNYSLFPFCFYLHYMFYDLNFYIFMRNFITIVMRSNHSISVKIQHLTNFIFAYSTGSKRKILRVCWQQPWLLDRELHSAHKH